MSSQSPVSTPVAHYSAGEMIFAQGQSDYRAYVIRTGEVEVSVEYEGRTLVLDTLRKGECFGEMALLDQKPRSATVTATEYTEVFVLEPARLEALLDVNPLASKVLRSLSRRLQRMNSEYIELQPTTPPMVAAAEILRLLALSEPEAAREGGSADSPQLVLPYRFCRLRLQRILGWHEARTREVLRQMANRKLIDLETGDDNGLLALDPHSVVEQAARGRIPRS